MAIKNSSNVNLPQTVLSLTLSPYQYEAEDTLLSSGTNYANWTVDAGSSKDSAGIQITSSGTEYAQLSVSGLSPDTEYWLSFVVQSRSASANGLLRIIGTSGGSNIGEPSNTANDATPVTMLANNYRRWVKCKTDGTSGPHLLKLGLSGTTIGQWWKIANITLVREGQGTLAILGDREGGYNATYASAVNTAILAASPPIMTVFAVGDQASTTNSYAVTTAAIKSGIEARGGSIYAMFGNHDYDASRETEHPTYFSAQTGLNAGKRYWKLSLTGISGATCDLFTLDDNSAGDNGGVAPPDGNGGHASSSFGSSVQATWLQSGLAASTADFKLVGIHHPPYTSSSTGPFANCRLPFHTWGANVVFQSHDHGVERILINNIYHYTCAMGGSNHHGWTTILPETKFRLDSNISSSFANTHGFCKVTPAPTYLLLEYFNTSGLLLDRARIRKA